jgi:hypothetical protein
MKPLPKRPIAVWIALGILLLYIPLLLFGLIGPPDESVLNTRETEDLISDIALGAGILVSLLIAFWALTYRKQWGRWFILGPIAFFSGETLYEELFVPEIVSENIEDKMVFLVALCAGLIPLVIVFLLVSFGSRVKNYFALSGIHTGNLQGD